jgi:phosphohistidine phosphatase SixA
MADTPLDAWVGGRVILLELPTRDNNVTGHIPTSEELFKLLGGDVREVEDVNISGVIAITFGETDASDEELLARVRQAYEALA